MKSNYERHQYCIRYAIISVVVLLIGYYIGYFVLELEDIKIVIFMLLLVALDVVSFLFSYYMVSELYQEMESISSVMIDVVEGKEEIAKEEYRQGTVGILYTNFYKMVHTLKESKSKEQEEKEFLKDVISDISHQLKTPLASLKIFVDLLMDEKITDPQKRRNMLVESANQLSRMEWMVLSMLKLARIEAGAITFEKKNVNVSAMISQAAEAVRYLFDKRKQTFCIQCDEDISLECDGDWLTEAIINLLKNASDYSEEGKTIWFEVEKNNLYTRLYIRDEGMGIPEKDLPNIFMRFYRAHQEVNPNSVGIGLSLTKSIIEGMGGRITVRSEEGKSTCFILTFVDLYKNVKNTKQEASIQ